MTTSTSLQRLVRQLRQTAEHRRFDRVPDADLLERYHRTGDADAFEAIVRRHGGAVLAACRKVLSAEADVEDAFQATFIVLLRSAKSIRKGQSLGGWLSGVAYRVALKALAGSARRQQVEKRQRPSEAETPDLSWREACAVLHEELDQLPDKYRLPLLLCYLDGKSRDEAAHQLGCTFDVLRGRLDRGREQLRLRLTKRGVTFSAGLLAVLHGSAGVKGLSGGLVQTTVAVITSGRIPASVAALAQRGTAPAFATKLPLIAALVLLAGMVAAAVVSQAPAAAAPTAAPDLAAFAEPAAPPDVADEAEDTVEVKGQVQDPTGKPLAGAKVFLAYYTKERTQPKEQATSDSAGRFAFTFKKSEVNPHYLLTTDEGWKLANVVAVADGYGPQWVSAGALGKEPVTLRLVRDDVPLDGVVYDLEGRPVDGAVVRVVGIQASDDESLDAFIRTQRLGKGKSLTPWTAGMADAVTTDKDGRFRVAGIGRERLVELDISGAALETVGVRALTRKGVDEKALNTPRPEDAVLSDVRASDLQARKKVYGASVNHVAGPTRPLAGVVRDKASKKPLPGIRVGMVEQYGRGYAPVEAVTDDQGRFTLVGWPKQKQYRLVAARDGDGGFLTAFQSVADTEGLLPLAVDFELTPGVVVEGQLREKATGKPVRGGIVYEALPGNKNLESIPDKRYNATIRAGGDGSFRLVALPGPGVITVHNYEGRFMYARLTPADQEKGLTRETRRMMTSHAYATLAPEKVGEKLNLTFDLVPGKTREVSLTDPDGKPLTGVVVDNLADQVDQWKTLDTATCTAVGIDPERPRRITFLHAGRKLAGAVTLKGDEAEPVRVKLGPWGTLTGRAVDADGKPVAGVRVEMYHRAAQTSSLIRALRPTADPVLTGSDGSFRVEGIAPGLNYEAILFKREPGGYQSAVVTGLTVQSGGTRDLGQIQMRKQGDQ